MRTLPPAVVLWLAALAWGCASDPVYVGKPVPPDAPLPLWRVEAADGTPAGHLFGTFHALPEPELLDRRIFAALRKADALVVEMSPALDDETKAAIEQITIERGMYPPKEPGLDERLPPARYEELLAHAGKAGVPGFAFARMRPWLATVVVALGAARAAGFDPENSAEQQLVDGRGNPKMPIVELESAASQLAVLASVDEELYLADLETSAGQNPVDAMRVLYEAWRRGDIEAIEQLTFAPLVENTALAPMYERMFFKRNDEMAAKVLARLQAGGRPFVGVGAGHMVGARGLVAQIAAAGYRVTQVDGPAPAN